MGVTVIPALVRPHLALNPTTAYCKPVSTSRPPAGSVLRNNKEEIHQFTRPGTPLWPHGPPLALSRFLAFTPSALPASGPLHGCAPPPNTPVRPNDRTSSRRLCLHPVPLQHRRGTHPFPEPPVSLPHPTLSFLPNRTLGLFKVTMPNTPHCSSLAARGSGTVVPERKRHKSLPLPLLPST